MWARYFRTLCLIYMSCHNDQGQWWMNLQSYIAPPPNFKPSDSSCELLGQGKVLWLKYGSTFLANSIELVLFKDFFRGWSDPRTWRLPNTLSWSLLVATLELSSVRWHKLRSPKSWLAPKIDRTTPKTPTLKQSPITIHKENLQGAGKANPGSLWALDMRAGGADEPVSKLCWLQ